jgi:tetratricopeptide (TPR) repeat protein
VSNIHLVENHDQAYGIWKAAGVQDRILVHIDAHHDMWWCSHPRNLTIANFISQALSDRFVRSTFWVVPDESLRTTANRLEVVRQLKSVARGYPSKGKIRQEDKYIIAELLGKSVTVCTLDSLPPQKEPVLLDIDTDFLVIPRVSNFGYGDDDSLPWCWPSTLLNAIHRLALNSDLVTIAYSVNGGYTPLQWKYLGDELALRLRDCAPESELRGLELLRRASCASAHGDLALAEEILQDAKLQLPSSVAPKYHLARLLARLGRTDEAKHQYRQALLVDQTYETPYSSFGLVYYLAGHMNKAEESYRLALTLNPADASALMGLGRVEMSRAKWKEAERLFRRSLNLDAVSIDAIRNLAEVLSNTGRRKEAIPLLEQSLALALRGGNPLGGAITSIPDPRSIIDIAHWKTHARLARLHEDVGNVARAVAGYSMALKAGQLDIALSTRLLLLQVRQHNWAGACRTSGAVATRLCRQLGKYVRRFVRRFLL